MKKILACMAHVIALSTPMTIVGMSLMAEAQGQEQDIGFARAEQIALSQVKGKVTDIERDHELGKPVYEVEVRTPEGTEFEVTIDAQSGSVLRVKQDD